MRVKGFMKKMPDQPFVERTPVREESAVQSFALEHENVGEKICQHLNTLAKGKMYAPPKWAVLR